MNGFAGFFIPGSTNASTCFPILKGRLLVFVPEGCAAVHPSGGHLFHALRKQKDTPFTQWPN
jgi:hypothetical protein